MKKKYEKPVIVFDSFELSQSIASCGLTTNTTAGTCALYDEDIGYIFSSDLSVCKVIAPGTSSKDASWSGLCYEIPTGSISLFSS